MDAIIDSLDGKGIINIDEVLDSCREKGVVVPNVLEFLNDLNDEYILADKYSIAKYDELELEDSIIKEAIDMLNYEVRGVQVIRDLSCVYRFPAKKNGWNEWTIYSIVNAYADDLEVATSQEQFRYSVPLISRKGEMDANKIEELNLKDVGDVTIKGIVPDDLDSLIENLISDEE